MFPEAESQKLIPSLMRRAKMTCAVIGCVNAESPISNDIFYFYIPPEKYSEWRDILGGKLEAPLPKTICMCHFSKSMFENIENFPNSQKISLKWTAEPSHDHVFYDEPMSEDDNDVFETTATLPTVTDAPKQPAESIAQKMYEKYYQYYKTHKLERVRTALEVISRLYELSESEKKTAQRNVVAEMKLLNKINTLEHIKSMTMDKIFAFEEDIFYDTMGMSKLTFILLVDELQPILSSQIIPTEMQLFLTLRLLKGDSWKELSIFSTIEPKLIRSGVSRCMIAIAKHFRSKFSRKSAHYLNLECFYTFFNLPNCIGALGARKVPSLKGDFVVYAVCNTDGIFVAIDTNCRRLIAPFLLDCERKRRRLPGEHIVSPLYMVAGRRFHQDARVMVPRDIGDSKGSVKKQRISYNKRISRGARVADDAFAMLTSRWTVFQKRKNNSDFETIRCGIALHNFIVSNEKGCRIPYTGKGAKGTLKRVSVEKLTDCKTFTFQEKLSRYFMKVF